LIGQIGGNVAGSVIGIKIADGSFFPVFERSHKGKKKLVLTTVNDQQESVQIDLYQGEGQEMENPEYIGSLVVSNIQPAGKGEPEINLVLGIDGEGNLNATATDAATGEYESLSVSLESLEEELYSLPDFELEESSLDEAEQLTDFDLEEEELAEADLEPLEPVDEEPSPQTQAEEPEQAPIAYSRPAEEAPARRRGHVLLFIGFMVLSLAALALLVYFMFRLLRGPDVPPLEARLQPAWLMLAPVLTTRLKRGAQRHRKRFPR
jgi:hypothetical protein